MCSPPLLHHIHALCLPNIVIHVTSVHLTDVHHGVEWGLDPTLAPLLLLKHPFNFKNQTPHPFT